MTRCKRGHTSDDLYLRSDGRRWECRACRKLRNRENVRGFGGLEVRPGDDYLGSDSMEPVTHANMPRLTTHAGLVRNWSIPREALSYVRVCLLHRSPLRSEHPSTLEPAERLYCPQCAQTVREFAVCDAVTGRCAAIVRHEPAHGLEPATTVLEESLNR